MAQTESLFYRMGATSVVWPNPAQRYRRLMLLTPMPGSPIWRQALKESRIETLELHSWDAIHTTMPTRHLSRKRAGGNIQLGQPGVL